MYVGLIVALDYRDPRFAPFEAFQRLKHRPSLRALLGHSEREVYSALGFAARDGTMSVFATPEPLGTSEATIAVQALSPQSKVSNKWPGNTVQSPSSLYCFSCTWWHMSIATCSRRLRPR
jgi:hypothetical protein